MLTPRRVHAATFNASTTSVTVIDRAAFQPTMRREYTSVMTSMYTIPDHVEQYV